MGLRDLYPKARPSSASRSKVVTGQGGRELSAPVTQREFSPPSRASCGFHWARSSRGNPHTSRLPSSSWALESGTNAGRHREEHPGLRGPQGEQVCKGWTGVCTRVCDGCCRPPTELKSRPAAGDQLRDPPWEPRTFSEAIPPLEQGDGMPACRDACCEGHRAGAQKRGLN